MSRKIIQGGFNMFEMAPFRRNNNLAKRNDYFTKLYTNFFDDDFFNSMSEFDNATEGNLRVDLKETDNNYLVEADLPGVKKDAIDIEYSNNYLTISAKKDEAEENKAENYIRKERHYGEYKRRFYVDNVDENKIDASFTDGVLKITLPKLHNEPDNRKKINIH